MATINDEVKVRRQANVSYKVLYHVGESVDLKAKMAVGHLSLEQDRLLIQGPSEISIPLEALRSVELFRLHGTGRMLKLGYVSGMLFVSVIRFSLFGLFAVVNFFATGRLRQEIEKIIRERVTLNAAGTADSESNELIVEPRP